jgi:hypothetical protein
VDKKRLLEIIGGVFAILIVLSMIIFITISITVTNGYYKYYEVELKTSDNGYIYAVTLDDSIWEKHLDEPIGSVDINGVYVYKVDDEVLQTLKLIHREATIYQIGDRFYYRQNVFQIAF